jgi:hypothetical protein
VRREATGHYVVTSTAGESVRASVPAPLPPEPALMLNGAVQSLRERELLGADAAVGFSRRLRRRIQLARPQDSAAVQD